MFIDPCEKGRFVAHFIETFEIENSFLSYSIQMIIDCCQILLFHIILIIVIQRIINDFYLMTIYYVYNVYLFRFSQSTWRGSSCAGRRYHIVHSLL